MRSYRQYCSVAKGLDVIGDRWSLLIVRELLLLGPRRYTDLRDGLPGIATNMLADRLRELEEHGVLVREDAPPPIATTLYGLTPWGEELREVVLAIGRWAAPLMRQESEDDAFRSRWLALPAAHFLIDQTPDRAPIVIEVRTGDEPMLIETGEGDGSVGMRPGSADSPDAVVSGSPRLVLGVLSGNVPLDHARASGLVYDGDPSLLRRISNRGSTP